MKRIVPLLVGLCLLVGLAAPALAQVPPLPHAFYGDLTINDSTAPIGATVEARGEGVTTGIEGNPITVTEAGKYGGPGLDPKLVVQGDIEEGATITFYVNGTSTGQTAEWHSGEVTELDLSVTIVERPRPRPSPPAPVIETNLFGVEADFPISEDGEILETITATSEDGMLTITLPEGTIALDEDGNPLASLDISVDDDPPDPPEDAHIIGLAYDFGPDGATFDPWIMLEWSYDPAELEEGVNEEDLDIAFYDEEVGEWVVIDCVVHPETCEIDPVSGACCEVNPADNSITGYVTHFTTFAIIAPAPEEEEVIVIVPPTPPTPAAFSISNLSIQPSEVQPEETVTITVLVANTGGTEGSYTVVLMINGLKEAEESVTVAAGDSQEVSFSVAREDAGSYSVTVDGLSGSFTIVPPEEEVVLPEEEEEEVVPVPAKPINWPPLVGGIVGGVIVLGLLIYFLVIRRRRKAY